MEYELQLTYQLAKLFEERPNVQKLINKFSKMFFEMCHAENFDIRTVKFESIVPKGEPSKVLLVLQSAEYLDGTIKPYPDNEQSVSYKLIRVIRSFYSAFLKENSQIEGFVNQCPGFCDCIFGLVNYIFEYTQNGTKDLKGSDIMVGDNVAGDLVFYVYLK